MSGSKQINSVIISATTVLLQRWKYGYGRTLGEELLEIHVVGGDGNFVRSDLSLFQLALANARQPDAVVVLHVKLLSGRCCLAASFIAGIGSWKPPKGTLQKGPLRIYLNFT